MKSARKEKESTRCPRCGRGQLQDRRLTRRYSHEWEGKRIPVVARNMPVQKCRSCGEVFSGPEAARIHQEALWRAIDVLSPKEVRALRERLGLSPAALARKTGISVQNLTRWEAGLWIPTKAMDNFMRILAGDSRGNKLLAEFSQAIAKSG